MADPKSNKTQGNLYLGKVQMSFPAAGFCLVIPAEPTTVDKPIICRLDTTGGLLGCGLVLAPPANTLVTYTVAPGSDKAYLVSAHPQGCQPQGYMQELKLSDVINIDPMSSLNCMLNLLQHAEETNKNKEHATATVGLQDQYEGDLYFGDRYGPGIFTGRAQLTVKGSPASYIQMASTQDKINVLTAKAQFDSFTDKITITPSLTKVLKASGVLQGLGGRLDKKSEFPLLMQDNVPSKLKYRDPEQKPVFRSQTFQGGAAKGTYKTTVQLGAGRPVVVASDMQSYNGEHMSFFAQGTCSIKTLSIPGLEDRPFDAPLETQKGREQLEARKKQTEKILEQVKKKAQLSNNGLQRTLQLNKILQDDYEKALIAGMLGYEALQLQQEGVEPFDGSLKLSLADWDRQDFQQLQEEHFFSDGPLSADKYAYQSGLSRYANASFITQDPDGSITLKDGWGSQITMSHGNIYISSALDTFIRPGRNLIGMIPRHMSLATNGEIELASKKSIRVGAQENLQLASAISGKDGFTVLQNRSKENGDMVIRSNGNLSITSSKDMHIGINDKRTKNTGGAIEQADGSIFIQGKDIRVESRGELRLLGEKTGLYACDTSTGTGIQLSTAALSIISPSVNMDTGNLRIGDFQGNHSIKTDPYGQTYVTLKGGSATTVVHVRGQLQSRGLFVGGYIQASGPIAGQSYMCWKPEEQKTIPGTKEASIRVFRTQVSKVFNTPMQNSTLQFKENLQDWYRDIYICSKELSFMDTWGKITQMPTMCWQMLTLAEEYKRLESISVQPTGKNTKTQTYPGNVGWQNCKMSVIDDNYNVKYDGSISTDYKTFTKGE